MRIAQIPAYTPTLGSPPFYRSETVCEDWRRKKRTTIRLLQKQGDLTVVKMLPGSPEWLKFRLEYVGDEIASQASTAYWSLPDTNASEVTLCESAIQAYYYIRTLEECGFIRMGGFLYSGIKE